MRIQNVTNLSFQPNFKANFTELEKKLMKEAMEYSKEKGVETWRIIKNGKDITDQLTLIEEPKRSGGYFTKTDKIFGISVEKLGWFGNVIKGLRNRWNFINITHIHTHPREMSFSPTDIKAGLALRHKKNIVVTPSGKYAVIEFEKSKRKKALKLIESFHEWYEQNEHLYDGVKPEEKYKVTLKIFPKFLEKYIKDSGLKYESNIEWTP